MRTVKCGLTPLLAVLAVGLLVGAATAQQPDLLKEARARQEVAAQKADQMVKETLAKAEELQKQGRHSEALAKIRSALDAVQNNPDLPADSRDRLVRVLRASDQKIDGDLKNPVARNPNPVVRQPVDDRKDGFDVAKKTLDRRGVAVVDSRTLNDERSQRYLGVARDIDRSNMPPVGDYEFPKDWAEKSKQRIKSSNPMTVRERAILKALNEPMEFEFKGNFQEAIDYLSKVTGQPIIVDQQAMTEANVTYLAEVNFPKRKASTRTVLKKVLGDLGMTYIVKDETIYVTTPARAKDTMTTRTYYVGDLVSGDPRFGLVGNQLQMQQQVNYLLVLIQQTVEPDSWQYRGGPGSIYFEPATMTFVVTQSAEIHYMLGVGLRR